MKLNMFSCKDTIVVLFWILLIYHVRNTFTMILAPREIYLIHNINITRMKMCSLLKTIYFKPKFFVFLSQCDICLQWLYHMCVQGPPAEKDLICSACSTV